MKKWIILSFASLWLIACGNSEEKKGEAKLEAARTAFAIGNYAEAKNEIDSIKLRYPKAFNARREGIKLMREIELKEQEVSVIYLDSILTEKQEAFEAIKKKFVLEKDAEYQDIGNYLWPTQTVEKNLHRAYLRFQVNERGVLSMTSIYCGKGNIHHTAVKVTAPDGTFAETPSSGDSYETTDTGEKIEKADYPIGRDGNVMGFIYLNHDKNIRVEFLGDRKFTTSMLPADRQALKELYELSQILSAIEQAQKEKEEAKQKIEFLTRKAEN